MNIKVTNDKSYIYISMPYNIENINIIKSVKGHIWSLENKIWSIPNTEENKILINKLLLHESSATELEERSSDNSKIKYGEDSFKDNKELEKYYDILKIMEQELKLKGYSHKTKKSYIGHIRRFLNYYNKDAKDLNVTHVKNYMEHLISNLNSSASYINQAVSSIKFLLSNVLKFSQMCIELPRPKRENKLPNVLSQGEVVRILEGIANEKHKTLLFLAYSAGLRVSEIVNIKISDIDSNVCLYI